LKHVSVRRMHFKHAVIWAILLCAKRFIYGHSKEQR
jgi:hypothetical protein